MEKGLGASERELCNFADHVGWPVIAKPSGLMGGVGVRKWDSVSAVEHGRGKLRYPILVQKFIPGRRIVMDLFCSRGRLIGWLPSYSIAQGQGPFSYSTAREFRAMPALRPLAELLAAQSRFEGFCGVDCIEEAGTGRIFFLEFNPRLTSGWRCGRFCGVDMSPALAAWVDDAAADFPLVTVPAKGEFRAHYFPADLARCVKRRDWRGLRNWLPLAKSRHDVCWDDLGVLLAWVGGRLAGRKG